MCIYILGLIFISHSTQQLALPVCAELSSNAHLLQGDREVVMIAIQHNEAAVEFASPELKADVELCEMALIHPDNLGMQLGKPLPRQEPRDVARLSTSCAAQPLHKRQRLEPCTSQTESLESSASRRCSLERASARTLYIYICIYIKMHVQSFMIREHIECEFVITTRVHKNKLP